MPVPILALRKWINVSVFDVGCFKSRETWESHLACTPFDPFDEFNESAINHIFDRAGFFQYTFIECDYLHLRSIYSGFVLFLSKCSRSVSILWENFQYTLNSKLQQITLVLFINLLFKCVRFIGMLELD